MHYQTATGRPAAPAGSGSCGDHEAAEATRHDGQRPPLGSGGSWRRRGPWLSAALAVVLALGAAGAAGAQQFSVSPLRLEAAPRPGESVDLSLRIRNRSDTQPRTAHVRVVELGQLPSGGWRAIEEAGAEPGHGASCADWIGVPEDGVEMPPGDRVEVNVSVDVPQGSRGAYFAGLLVEPPPPEEDAEQTGVRFRLRYHIPVIVQIQGRPVRQQVELEDVVMAYEDGATSVHMRVANEGRTWSRVAGALMVERRSGDRWRPVTRMDLRGRGIMPGTTLELGEALDRRIPSGEYRLRAEARVDGRRIAPVEREIAFEGDPSVDELAYDTALLLDPETVELAIAPGATRYTVLSLENPGEDPVEVRMAALQPRGLQGASRGEVDGAAFSAEPWTDIRPSAFTIRPGGRQNVRVTTRPPAQGLDRAGYYADLVVQGRYDDGQSAGNTRTLAMFTREGVEADPAGEIERVQLAESGEPSAYIVQARFANTGEVHLDPEAQAEIIAAEGGARAAEAELAGEEALLLPLAERTYSGVMDFSEVEPGAYVLRTDVAYGGGANAVDVTPIEVAAEPDPDNPDEMIRRVTVLDAEAGN